jgi:xylulokinase
MQDVETPLLVGLDAGTSATKACAFTQEGVLVAEAGVPVTLSQPAPGLVEQPAEELVRSAVEALRALSDRIGGRAVASMGITGQMGGLVLVGADGHAVSPHLSWLDGRASAAVDSAMDERGARLLELGGLPPYLAPKSAWWKRERPRSFARARAMLMPAGFLALRLGGEGAPAAAVDRSSCGFVGLFDVCTGAVEEELCELWGISAELAPRIVGVGELVGRLSAEAAGQTGLPEGLPLFAAPGDGPCGWLGVGAVEPGITVDTAGSSDHIGICGSRFAPDVERGVLICLPSPVEGLWHLQGYTSGTGLTHRWFLETFAAGSDFAELERLAATVAAGSEQLVCIPHFGGRVCPYQPAVSGVYVGLTWRHGREHLYRALLESVAYEYACYLEAARRVDPTTRPREVRVIGGGATSRLWTQIKADVLGLPLVLMEDLNYTCWGAALAAGKGVAMLDDLAAAALATARVREVIEPNPATGEGYRRLVDVYKRLFDELDGSFRTLSERRQKESQRPGL